MEVPNDIKAETNFESDLMGQAVEMWTGCCVPAYLMQGVRCCTEVKRLEFEDDVTSRA